MWTDGRYYLQAGKQLEAGWEMQKMEPGVLTYFEWISTNLQAGDKIGVDPSQIGAGNLMLITNLYSWVQKQIYLLHREEA
jgi:Xaa-Pro aminopeptidase